jgi:hypothetical protein
MCKICKICIQYVTIWTPFLMDFSYHPFSVVGKGESGSSHLTRIAWVQFLSSPTPWHETCLLMSRSTKQACLDLPSEPYLKAFFSYPQYDLYAKIKYAKYGTSPPGFMSKIKINKMRNITLTPDLPSAGRPGVNLINLTFMANMRYMHNRQTYALYT